MTEQLGSLNYFFWHAWDFDFSIIIGCSALIIAYVVWTKLKFARSFLFFLGVGLLFLALTSPLDALSDEYLFSAHMIQHFILLMVVPPLLILGLPEEPARKILTIPWISKTEHVIAQPVFAWLFSNLILWIWHLPFLYDWAVKSEGIHIVEHLTFLISASIFWWLVLAPTNESRLSFSTGMIYLFLAGLSNMALGILLTFLNEPIYGAYKNPEDSWKILQTLRLQFHLDPLADQKLGGILMWVLGSVVFLAVILIHLGYWYENEDLLPDLRMEKV